MRLDYRVSALLREENTSTAGLVNLLEKGTRATLKTQSNEKLGAIFLTVRTTNLWDKLLRKVLGLQIFEVVKSRLNIIWKMWSHQAYIPWISSGFLHVKSYSLCDAGVLTNEPTVPFDPLIHEPTIVVGGRIKSYMERQLKSDEDKVLN